MAVPAPLTAKIELFRATGQIFREEDELFNETSWTAVMMGQGITMGGHNVMADALPLDKLQVELAEMEKSIRYLVGTMPSHGDYLKKYCPAPERMPAVTTA